VTTPAPPSTPAPPRQRRPVIAVRDVHKTYGRGDSAVAALRGVSLDVHDGESIAIVGKSGSGKSTLMHLLAMLDAPTSGSLTFDGVDSRSMRGARLNRLRNRAFGFVFQQFFLTPSASVLENVVLPLTIAGVPRRERNRRGMAVLDQLEMTDKARSKATDLSGGQKQRAVIARALINNPRVIFADEPTGNLDSTTGAAVEEILFGLNTTHGITLVVVTHDADTAGKCDRQLHIRDGLVVDEQAAAA